MNLDQLIADFQKGDEKAFSQLYQLYSKNILGVILNIVRDDAIAQDVTQEVFLKVWNNAGSYSPSKGRFFTWILNIARNAAIDKIRSKDFKTHSKNLDSQNFVDILVENNKLESQINAIGLQKFIDRLASNCIQLIELLYFRGLN